MVFLLECIVAELVCSIVGLDEVADDSTAFEESDVGVGIVNGFWGRSGYLDDSICWSAN